MEAYKNYLVDEVTHDRFDEFWTVAIFHTMKEAIDFAKAYSPRPCVDRIEVIATDEDPDTYRTCDRVYNRNCKETPEEKKLRELAERIFNLADPWDRDEVTMESIEKAIKEDPEAVIEKLLDTIEENNA